MKEVILLDRKGFMNMTIQFAKEEMIQAKQFRSLSQKALEPYRKKKFHSILQPPQGVKTDMRLVYRCDLQINRMYVLGVGKRKLREIDDVYEILSERDPI
jgi:hypothetical protein